MQEGRDDVGQALEVQVLECQDAEDAVELQFGRLDEGLGREEEGTVEVQGVLAGLVGGGERVVERGDAQREGGEVG